jgi:hypothetical protein
VTNNPNAPKGWKPRKRLRRKPCDLEFTVFLFTCDPRRVAKEAFVESPQAAYERHYDRTTAGKLALIHYLALPERTLTA